MSNPAAFVRALGGPANILDVEGCVTRVRLEVCDSGRVDAAELRDLGALAVVVAGPVVQVVVGPHADALALDILAVIRSEQTISH